MDKIAVIPPIKINLSIRNRRKDFNKLKQFANPFKDNKFELPKSCAKHDQNNPKYKCSTVKLEDIIEFRTGLFKTTEKREQNEFISNYLNVKPVKRRRSLTVSIARIMSVSYNIPIMVGSGLKEIPICRQMFFAVTGIPEQRLLKINEGLYKNQLLQLGDDNDPNETKVVRKKSEKQIEREEKYRISLNARKERILSLKKGTFEVFSSAMKKLNNKENPLMVPVQIPNNELLEQSQSKPIILEEICIDEDKNYFKIEDSDMKVLIDTNFLDVCRLCLASNEDLISIFEKNENLLGQSPADMISYSFSMKPTMNDQLPNKICQKCLQKLIVAVELKNEILESELIMTSSLQEYENVSSSYLNENWISSEEYIEQFPCQMSEASKSLQIDQQNENVDEKPQEFFEIGFDCDLMGDSFEDLIEEEILETFTPDQFDVNYPKPIKCFICNLDFPENTTPEEHFEIHHNQVQSIKCDKCDFSTEFPWFQNLHLQIHAENLRICPYCGKTYVRDKISNHFRRCPKKDNLKKYQCRFCDSTYVTSSSRNEHERLHTQEKPFHCNQCNQKFHRKINLRRHMITHGVMAFQCKKCLKGFIQEAELNSHKCIKNTS